MAARNEADAARLVGAAMVCPLPALSAGSAFVAAAAQRYTDTDAARGAGPVIAALRQRVEQTCVQELARLVNPVIIEPEDLTRAAHAIPGKLLHRPTISARAAAASGDTDALLALCDLFGVPSSDVGPSELSASVPRRTP